MIELIVFDWDGTLMDSEARIVQSMTEAFLDQAIEVPPPSAIREVIGLDLHHAVGRLNPDLDARAIDRIAAGYRRLYPASLGIPSPLFEGARDTLDELSRHGIQLAVATGKSRRGLDRAMHETGVAHYFTATRCGDETRPKTHPAMLLEILNETGVIPSRAIMVGDTEFNLETAAAASILGAAVTYGAHPKSRLLGLNPVVVVDTLRELPGEIKRLGPTAKH